MRIAARIASLSLLFAVAALLASCSLASPAPVSQPQAQQPAVPQQQPAQPFQLPTRRPSVTAGADLYQQKCVQCHGASGRGDGAMAAQIQARTNTPVADLTSDVVARARTPQEWYNIVSNGNLQKGMPGFAGSLDADQRWDVIAYAWSLAVSPQRAAQGQQVYAAQCVQCHGAAGKGDGKDAQGKLSDLSAFATLAQVAPGTWDQALASGHVPSFAGTLSEDDRRAAIDYVRTFAYDYSFGTPAVATTPGAVAAQTPSTQTPPAVPQQISGYLVLGTPGQTLPSGLSVLFEFQRNSDNAIISQTVPLDAQGHFVVTATQMNHGDLMRASTEYDSITYYSDVVAAGLQATLPITIYERTTDASTARASVLHVIAQPTDQGLSVNEVYVMSTKSDRVAANPGQPILHISLPAGATQFTADPNMPADTLVLKGDGLDFFGSLPTAAQGTESIAFSYMLPKDATTLDRVVAFPIDLVNLLVQGDLQTVRITSDRFASQGTRDFQGTTYQLFQANNLTAGQRVALKIEPAGSTPAIDGRVVLGAVLVLIGVVGLIIWQVTQRKRPAVATARAVSIEKEALIDQIAALDDDFADGQLDEVNYKAKRAKLKDKLIKLMDEE